MQIPRDVTAIKINKQIKIFLSKSSHSTEFSGILSGRYLDFLEIFSNSLALLKKILYLFQDFSFFYTEHNLLNSLLS